MIARVLACLLMLQGFIVAAGPSLAEQASDPAGWSEIHATATKLCASENGVANPLSDHSSCERCMFCTLGARGVALTLAALWRLTAISPPEPDSRHAPRSADAAESTTPPGWASTWSSRAPPSFS
ncbi:hypothetical protein MSC49_01770 [Methylosinus sp. C49]|uniref:hypothetical protein n=1 Tax=Methylosinus sp. C49 TaxID=2699395 RepID=UPI00136768DC|nr:hypothetical protein [Methylosinus sp. C49]BBU60242.1 hypothetical protein MSC49_01770 [Methylosinus sp. C49]